MWEKKAYLDKSEKVLELVRRSKTCLNRKKKKQPDGITEITYFEKS